MIYAWLEPKMLPSDSERLDELENGQSQLGYLTRGKVETGVIPQMVTYPFNSTPT